MHESLRGDPCDAASGHEARGECDDAAGAAVGHSVGHTPRRHPRLHRNPCHGFAVG